MQFNLESEVDANRVVQAMNKLVDEYGEVTVSDLNGLLGMPTVYASTKVGWKSVQSTLHPGDGSYVILELPEPQNLTPEVKPRELIRVVFEIENYSGIAGEDAVLDAINNTPLRLLAKSWSMSKRTGPIFPWGNYTPRAYGTDDV